MSGIATWQQWKVPVRLTSMIRAQDSVLISVKGEKSNSPALVTRTVIDAQLAADLGEGVLDGGPVGDVGADPECGDPLRVDRRRPVALLPR